MLFIATWNTACLTRRMFSVSPLTFVMSRDIFSGAVISGIQARISISSMGKIGSGDFPCWSHWSFSCHVPSVACQGLKIIISEAIISDSFPVIRPKHSIMILLAVSVLLTLADRISELP